MVCDIDVNCGSLFETVRSLVKAPRLDDSVLCDVGLQDTQADELH